MANYYKDFAEDHLQNNIQDALRSVNYYQKAIMLYRNGEPQLAESAHKRLVEIQKEIPQIMSPVSIEIDIRDAESIKFYFLASRIASPLAPYPPFLNLAVCPTSRFRFSGFCGTVRQTSTKKAADRFATIRK